ncbi:hypothetical protein Tco_0632354 [Tanacetum coccineum]
MVAKNTKKTPQDSASKQPDPATKRAPPKKPTTTTYVKPTKPPSSKQPKSPTKKPSKQGDDPALELAKKMSLDAHQEKGEGEGVDANIERAIKLSLDPSFLPQGRAPVGGVTIRDPVSETTPKLPEVVGKGKAIVTEEQVAHSLIDLSKKKRTTDQFILKVVHESSSTFDSERTESETEAAAPKDDKEQGEVASSTVTSGTGSDSGKVHVSYGGPNPEHMDDEFLATAYPKVHENLKLITDERVIEDNPESHSGSMSSMKNLEDTDNIRDQFLYDKPTEDDQEKSKVVDESDSTIPDPIFTGHTSTDQYGSYNYHHISPRDHSFHRHALMEALIADEDVMDKEVKDRVKDHKRKHKSDDDEDDDDDEGPSVGSNQGKSSKRRRHDSGASRLAQPPPKDDEQSSKKPQDSDASASKQHLTLTSTGWQITDTRDAVIDSLMHSYEPESDLEVTDNAHIPKVKAATWFKPIQEDERPATPEPEWTIPPNDFPEPENNWANAYATSYQVPVENKLQRKTYDIGSFIKWFCRRTGKKKLCKADLEGPAFNLVKAFHKNNVFLQFQMDECHKLLTNKVDLVNPEGHPILRNIYEPLPLGGPPGQVTIQPQFFFNKDLEYLLTGDKERKTALSISKLKAARYLDFGLEELVPSLWVESERDYDIIAAYGITHWWFRRKEFYINKHSEPSDREAVRSQMRILSVIRIKTLEKYGYNYLREIILRRADYKEYKISEKDFKNLHPNDFEDLYLLNIQDKLNHLSKSDKTHLHTAVNMWIRNLVIRNRVGDLQLRIESYQTKLNLERPNWDATDYFFKEDYTIVPKPRAVIYRDRNDQRKLMRLNEIHKFSDGTLTRVMEKLDHMVKDFHLFEYNKGMETRKWSEDDKRRSKDFITAIEKRLQIRRIFRSLESFVGGRIRDIDYRLINRTT